MIEYIETLWPRQNGRQFAEDIFKCIFLNENVWISIKISLNFVPGGPIKNIHIPALVQIMAWRRPGDKSLSEPMMVCLLTHICVTRPQWVKIWRSYSIVFYITLSHYHHHADFSESIELMKCLSGIFCRTIHSPNYLLYNISDCVISVEP